MNMFIVTIVCLSSAFQAQSQSYSTFTGYGQSYGHSHDHKPYKHASYPLVPYTPAPYTPAPYTPAPYTPAPYTSAPYTQAPYTQAPYTPAPYTPAPYTPAPYKPYKPAYPSYETPKHNCTIQEVTEIAEVCTPAFETSCEKIELPIKKIIEKEFCYKVTKTVCSETVEEIPNEICSFNYQKKNEETTAKTVNVSFKKESKVQMVTVCAPGYGQGYSSYGHQICKEVAQETSFNVPIVTSLDVPVNVTYPEAIKTCVNKPILLPRISCNDVVDNKCIKVPEIENATESVEKCVTKLGAPSCQKINLVLPKQVCIELVYGYAENTKQTYPEEPKPSYPHV